MEDDFNDFSELSAGDTSIALRRCFAQVTAERDQLRAEVDRLRGAVAVIDNCESVIKHASFQFSSHAGEQDNVALCENALEAIKKWKNS